MKFSYFRKIFDAYFRGDYTGLEWTAVKITFLWSWSKAAVHILRETESVPFPHGICKYIDCGFICVGGNEKFFLVLTAIFSLLYLFERAMIVSTLYFFLMSMVAFSLEQSNGLLLRNELYTGIFFVQLLAYSIHHYRKKATKLNRNRYQWSVQIIAAGYFLSAMSKLKDSGIEWVADAQFMPLQIVKSFYYMYVSYGEEHYIREGLEMGEWMVENSLTLQLLTGSALLFEFFVFIALISRMHMRIFGILLTGMHIGINIVMQIWIGAIVWPMIFFFVNPLFLFILFMKSPGNWIKTRFFRAFRPNKSPQNVS